MPICANIMEIAAIEGGTLMNCYRCLICGDPYMGSTKPSNCPFCGANEKYLVNAAEWVDENVGLELSEISRKNFEKTIQLEVNNSAFYRDAMAKTGDIELQGIFKYLSKVENEHASTVKKILKCEPPKPESGKEVVSDSDIENLKAALAKEKEAAAFYAQASAQATEPRAKKVFTALSEVESDHIHLEEALIKRQKDK